MALGSCHPSGRWDEVLVHESEDAFTDLLEFGFHFRRIPSRTTPAVRCLAFFVVCNSFLSVSNLSCRLSFLLSLDNLPDLNLHLMFFVLRLPSLQSTWLLQRSVPPVVSVSPPFQLGCFLLLNFNLRFNLNLVSSCFLGNFQFLFCCHALMTFSILVFSSSVQLLSSRHCSPHTSRPAVATALSVLSRLLLAALFSPAVGYALLACCWLRSSACCWLCSSVTLFS